MRSIDSKNHNNGKTRQFSRARRRAALWAALVLGFAFGAGRLEAAPFAYAPNSSDGTVSVIDIAANTVATTLQVGVNPIRVVVTPNGKAPM